MVDEYEIDERIESINQQLDYAQGTLQSLKEDSQYQHSTFLEWTIVFLISFEIFFEMYALGLTPFGPGSGEHGPAAAGSVAGPAQQQVHSPAEGRRVAAQAARRADSS